MTKHKKNNSSRRDFLKKTALSVGGISAATSGFAFTSSAKEKNDPPPGVEVENCDVAVVGAGVSGTYAALRLANIRHKPPGKQKGVKPINKLQTPRPKSLIDKYLEDNGLNQLKVRLFEYSGRVGGRLLSTPIQGIPMEDDKSGPLQYAEFGGFRFDRQMKIVWETAQALGLKDEPFYYQDITVEENNIVNVRGNIYTNSNSDPDVNRNGQVFTDSSYHSYPNIGLEELKLLKAGFDLGNYITNQAFEGVLPNADSNTKLGPEYPNIDSIKEKNIQVTIKGRTYDVPSVVIKFKKSFNPAVKKPPTVTIPGGTNGWSFSYVRYHYAYNLEDWDNVKIIADQYEAAKPVAKIGGRPFYNWSWWALKRYFLSQEAVAYLEDTSGYNEEGTAGTVETNIDENYYFSVKSSDSELTYYSPEDPYSAQTAWRHIREGYSAIPKELFSNYSSIKSTTGNNQFTPNKSIDVVKHQLVAFAKEAKDGVYSHEKPRYKCLFLKRKEGPANAVTGSEALHDYMRAVAILKDPSNNPFIEKEKKDAANVVKRYKIVHCNFLVLALPRRALEMIDQNNFFFAARGVQSVLRNSVHNIPAMRMFVAYPRPWWLDLPPYQNQSPAPAQSEFYPVGRTRTDLGIRQLYYWCYNKSDVPLNPNQPNNYADPDKPAVMLASYTSGVATLYWRSIQNGQPYDLLTGSQTNQAHLYNSPSGKPKPGDNIRNPQKGGPRHGSQAMGLEAHRQIVELHGMTTYYNKIPLPYYVHFEDWTKDPWGAGWHSWQSNYPKVNYIPLIRNPLPDENVFIIGECYSNVQGWVQGALNSAESMLQCNFGLQWAPWLSVSGIWLGQGTKWVKKTRSNPDPNPCLEEKPFPRVINVLEY